MIDAYFQGVTTLLKTILTYEKDAIQKAGEKIAESISNQGIVHLFGCGHSHLVATDAYYRAGGLVPIQPIFIEELMLHQDAIQSSHIEKKNGYAEKFMRKVDVRPEDVVIVISTSGRNPVPIDVAQIALEKGAYVIAVTSLQYRNQFSSKHEQGYYLSDIANIVINNHVPIGDTLLSHPMSEVPFGPVSTIISMTIVHGMIVTAIEQLIKDGTIPPVFLSGNIEHTTEYNERLISSYQSRIKFSKR
jgi:uncharacterized phosphosugar-binding protein